MVAYYYIHLSILSIYLSVCLFVFLFPIFWVTTTAPVRTWMGYSAPHVTLWHITTQETSQLASLLAVETLMRCGKSFCQLLQYCVCECVCVYVWTDLCISRITHSCLWSDVLERLEHTHTHKYTQTVCMLSYAYFLENLDIAASCLGVNIMKTTEKKRRRLQRGVLHSSAFAKSNHSRD